jgi:hypothetical protein
MTLNDTIMTAFKIVVARYSESIEWLLPILHHCIIINKGEPLNIKNEKCITNVGRESESYLHYIIDNYHDLPEIVLFTQATITDHISPNETPVEYLHKLLEEAEQNGASLPRASHNYMESPALNSEFGPQWNIINKDFAKRYSDQSAPLFCDWFCEHVLPVYPNPIHMWLNGLFAVRRENIVRKPIEYYEKLLKTVNHNIDPVEGHFFERSWYYIFLH